jgi:enoyl-CoA hydratase/carnithine racemase
MSDAIVYTVEDPVAVIRLNRPDQLNAFDNAMLAAFRDAVEQAAADPGVVGIIVTGTGRGFCAGLDIGALEEIGRSGSQAVRATPEGKLPGLFSYLLEIDKPVLSAINGVTAGGGLVLAAMSDLRFAARDAVLTSVFPRRGLVAEHGTTWTLPRLLGTGRALDLLWSSRKIDAQEALRVGLVEFVTGPEALLSETRAYVEQLAATVSPASLRDTKHMVYRHLGLGYREALVDTDRIQTASLDRPDVLEGARSFIEKRPPRFPRLGEPED